MSHSISISKTMINNAVLKKIRSGGESTVSIRKLAGELNCSTQPIYSQFQNMNDLLDHTARIASDMALDFIIRYKQTGFLALDMGLAYLRLCKQEKHLLKFLISRGESVFDLKRQVEHIKQSDIYIGISDTILADISRKTWLFVQGLASNMFYDHHQNNPDT